MTIPQQRTGPAFGPEPTSAVSYDTATQLHQTGHWCIAQHFQMASDGTADLPAALLRVQLGTTHLLESAGSCRCKVANFIGPLQPYRPSSAVHPDFHAAVRLYLISRSCWLQHL
jgi:hypothetical protein